MAAGNWPYDPRNVNQPKAPPMENKPQSHAECQSPDKIGELEPCPWCQKTDMLDCDGVLGNSGGANGFPEIATTCDRCGVTGPFVQYTKGRLMPIPTPPEMLAASAEAWNTRHVEAHTAHLVAALYWIEAWLVEDADTTQGISRSQAAAKVRQALYGQTPAPCPPLEQEGV